MHLASRSSAAGPRDGATKGRKIVDESEVRDEGAHQIERGEAGEGDSGPSPWDATTGNKPLEAEMREEERDVFPPNVAPAVDIGGSAEERQILEEEMNR